MNRARWYSSSTALTNGEIYIQGGNGGGDRPEVRDLNGNFRLLSNVNTSSLAATFPRNFLAPDGRVFGYDTNGKMYYVNTTGTGQITTAGQFNSSYAGWTSSAAMYRPGKILQMGGNSTGSVVIDITGPQPVVTPVNQLMSSKRQWVSATVLADGRVVATGGSGAGQHAHRCQHLGGDLESGDWHLDRRAEWVARTDVSLRGLAAAERRRADYRWRSAGAAAEPSLRDLLSFVSL